MFEYLIEDFRTYKPLLSAVKTEYELYISELQRRVRELEPLSVGIMAAVVVQIDSWNSVYAAV